MTPIGVERFWQQERSIRRCAMRVFPEGWIDGGSAVISSKETLIRNKELGCSDSECWGSSSGSW
jgi:hypothetical protein